MSSPEPVTREINTVKLDVNGKTVSFNVAADDGSPALFSMGVRKSGSTLLHKIVQFMSRCNQANNIDIPGTFFKSGFTVADWEKRDLSAVLQNSNVYVGYRTYPENHVGNPVFDNAPKILMYRDPRDVLVSQYFSDSFSHSVPQGNDEASRKGREAFLRKREEAQATPIDDYVVEKARSVQATMLSFKPMMSDPTCLMLRYEEYIFTKKRLIAKILKHFGWKLAPGQIDRLLDMVDVVPDKEAATSFVRKAVPGDHRVKLERGTIRKLDNILEETMTVFDYY